jgi:hypothetical protein
VFVIVAICTGVNPVLNDHLPATAAFNPNDVAETQKWMTRTVLAFDSDRMAVRDNELLVRDVVTRYNTVFDGLPKKTIEWRFKVQSVDSVDPGAYLSIPSFEFPNSHESSRHSKIDPLIHISLPPSVYMPIEAENGGPPFVSVSYNFADPGYGSVHNKIPVKDPELAKRFRRGSIAVVTGTISGNCWVAMFQGRNDRHYDIVLKIVVKDVRLAN